MLELLGDAPDAAAAARATGRDGDRDGAGEGARSTRVKRRDPNNIYHKMTAAELRR